MDPATLVGLIGLIGIIASAILMGASLGTFIDVPSILIVFGGTAMAVLMRFRVGQAFGSFKIAAKSFTSKIDKPEAIIAKAVELATIVRREGLLALENQEVENPFFQKGLRLCVDGLEPDFVRKVLEQDMEQNIERHVIGQKIFKAVGDVAPAMGMIGTLIGLVQMLAKMDDPKAIGPAMAVALLTTLYGAMIAHMWALPIADKLAARTKEETVNKALIIETVGSIQEGRNPRVMEELLKSYLPTNRQSESVADAAAPAGA